MLTLCCPNLSWCLTLNFLQNCYVTTALTSLSNLPPYKGYHPFPSRQHSCRATRICQSSSLKLEFSAAVLLRCSIWPPSNSCLGGKIQYPYLLWSSLPHSPLSLLHSPFFLLSNTIFSELFSLSLWSSTTGPYTHRHSDCSFTGPLAPSSVPGTLLTE